MTTDIAPFNPNTAGPDEQGMGFPVYKEARTAEEYMRFFEGVGVGIQGPVSPFQQWIDGIVADVQKTKSIQKAGPTTLPPDMQSFTRISMMPEAWNAGVIQWPGIPPEALQKIVRENVICGTILGLRVDDVLRYSSYSAHPWKPGWAIRLRRGYEHPGSSFDDTVMEARRFIENCCYGNVTARERDAKKLLDFPRFLAALARDTLTYDGMAIWTDCDLKGRVLGFKCLSAFNVRLAGPSGYKGDPNMFAVAVDEAGNVIHGFTREELIWYTRNTRADADVWGYGLPEVEVAIKLIQAFQAALDMNADVFNKSSIPNGFLTISGKGWNQRQIDILSRMWMNLKRGQSKSWGLPVIPVPEGGKLELVNMAGYRDLDVLYKDFSNMLAGLFCSVYRFPVTRLGYHTSGQNQDSKPDTPTTSATIVDIEDPGLEPLLLHIQSVINQYIVWSRWEHLEFCFTAKSPKEDAREYEARTLAATVDERRALSDLPKLETLASGEQDKQLMRLMGQAPADPALGGVYQAAIASVYGKKEERKTETEEIGPAFGHKKDPARAEDHGHPSGVRRDSAAEARRAEA